MKRVAHIAWQLLVCAPGMVWLVPTGATLLAVGVIGMYCAAEPGRGAFAGVVGFGLLLTVFSPLFAGGFTVGALVRRSATLLAPQGRVHLWLGVITAQLLLCASIAAVPAVLLVAFPGIAGPLGPGLMFERVFGTALALVALSHTSTSVLMLVPQPVRIGAGLAALPVVLWVANAPASPKQAWIASHSGELTLERCLFIAVMWALFAAGMALLPRRHRHAARVLRKDASAFEAPLTWSAEHFLGYSESLGRRWVLPVAAVLVIGLTQIVSLGTYLEAGLLGIYFGVVFDSGRRITVRSRQLWLRAGLDRLGVAALTERMAWRRLLESTAVCASALCLLRVRPFTVDIELLCVAGLVTSIGIVALYFARLNPAQSGRGLALFAQHGLLTGIEIVVYRYGTDTVRQSEGHLPTVLGLVLLNLALAGVLRTVGQRQWHTIDWRLC